MMETRGSLVASRWDVMGSCASCALHSSDVCCSRGHQGRCICQDTFPAGGGKASQGSGALLHSAQNFIQAGSLAVSDPRVPS